jgi:hypothetical protein
LSETQPNNFKERTIVAKPKVKKGSVMTDNTQTPVDAQAPADQTETVADTTTTVDAGTEPMAEAAAPVADPAPAEIVADAPVETAPAAEEPAAEAVPEAPAEAVVEAAPEPMITPVEITPASEAVQMSVTPDPVPVAVATGAGVVVATASADVGSAPQEQVNTAGQAFAQALQDRTAQQKLTEFNIEGYSPELQQALIRIFENPATSVPTKSLLQFTLKYSAEMSANSPVGGGVGEGLQRNFFTEFTTFVNLGPADFRLGMSVLLTIIKESAARRGGFHAHLPFRFLPNVVLTDDNVKALEAMMYLLQQTADVATRQLALKQINLTRALRHGFSAEGQQRLVQFYQF